jgi:hypothetical protein
MMIAAKATTIMAKKERPRARSRQPSCQRNGQHFAALAKV